MKALWGTEDVPDPKPPRRTPAEVGRDIARRKAEQCVKEFQSAFWGDLYQVPPKAKRDAALVRTGLLSPDEYYARGNVIKLTMELPYPKESHPRRHSFAQEVADIFGGACVRPIDPVEAPARIDARAVLDMTFAELCASAIASPHETLEALENTGRECIVTHEGITIPAGMGSYKRWIEEVIIAEEEADQRRLAAVAERARHNRRRRSRY